MSGRWPTKVAKVAKQESAGARGGWEGEQHKRASSTEERDNRTTRPRQKGRTHRALAAGRSARVKVTRELAARQWKRLSRLRVSVAGQRLDLELGRRHVSGNSAVGHAHATVAMLAFRAAVVRCAVRALLLLGVGRGQENSGREEEEQPHHAGWKRKFQQSCKVAASFFHAARRPLPVCSALRPARRCGSLSSALPASTPTRAAVGMRHRSADRTGPSYARLSAR